MTGVSDEVASVVDPDVIPRAPAWADVPTVPPDIDLEDIDQWIDDDGEHWQRDSWWQWFSVSELERERHDPDQTAGLPAKSAPVGP